MHIPAKLKSVALPVPELIGGTQKYGSGPPFRRAAIPTGVRSSVVMGKCVTAFLVCLRISDEFLRTCTPARTWPISKWRGKSIEYGRGREDKGERERR